MLQLTIPQGRSLFHPLRISEEHVTDVVRRYRAGSELLPGEHKLLIGHLASARPDLVRRENELRFAGRQDYLLNYRRQDTLVATLIAADIPSHLNHYPEPVALLDFLRETLPPLHFRRDAFGVTPGKPFHGCGNSPAKAALLEYFDALPVAEQVAVFTQHLRSRPCLLECAAENPLLTRLLHLLPTPAGKPLHEPVLDELASLAASSPEIAERFRPKLQALPYDNDFTRAFRDRCQTRLELFPYWYEPGFAHDAMLAGLFDRTDANTVFPVFALLRLHRTLWSRSVMVRGAVLDLICSRLLALREHEKRPRFWWNRLDGAPQDAESARELYDAFPWNDDDWLACISRGRFSADMLTLPLHGMSPEVRVSVETAFA